uniref:Uncharacterized protein n=1 Tax=Anguilla anguilla TaxID=7936 RepID=A0A0E9PCC7_ANGAN
MPKALILIYISVVYYLLLD